MKEMMTNNPSLDLVEFIETQILPQYAAFDKAHNMEHVTRVIRASLDLARKTGADIDMAYAIAAYHDLGLSGPRAIHHLTSGKILMGDARLKRWFSAEQLKLMKEAVEDHRAVRQPHGCVVVEEGFSPCATPVECGSRHGSRLPHGHGAGHGCPGGKNHPFGPLQFWGSMDLLYSLHFFYCLCQIFYQEIHRVCV